MVLQGELPKSTLCLYSYRYANATAHTNDALLDDGVRVCPAHHTVNHCHFNGNGLRTTTSNPD